MVKGLWLLASVVVGGLRFHLWALSSSSSLSIEHVMKIEHRDKIGRKVIPW